MANISKINISGTSYDLSDSTARAGLITAFSVTQAASKITFKSTKTGNTEGPSVDIPAATSSQAGLMSSTDKARLDSLAAISSGGMHFVGITKTDLVDDATTDTLEPATEGSLTKTTGFITGDLVIKGKKEFVWTGDKWILFGDQSNLGALAFKATASGSVTIPATDHTHSVSINGLQATVTQGSVSSSGNYTPAGSVTLANKAATDKVVNPEGKAILTEADFVTKRITYPLKSTPKSVYQITGVGTLPTLGTAISVPNVTGVGKMFAASVSGEVLTLTAGSVPTLGTAISVPNVTSVGSLPTRSQVTGLAEFDTTATSPWDFSVMRADIDETDTTKFKPLANFLSATFAGSQKGVTVSGTTTGVAVSIANKSVTTGAPSKSSTPTITVS